MSELKFLHTSDWQIGMTRWFLAGEAQARFDAARIAAIRKLGEIALAENCAFIVVAGDVFESNSLNTQTTGRVREALRSLPVPVYLLPGNHDPLTADSIFYSKVAQGDNIHIISDCQPVAVAPGFELVGAPLTAKRASDDRVRLALEPLKASECKRIAVGHGQALGFTSDPAPDLIDLDFVSACIDAGTIAYLALGDTHSTQQVDKAGRVWFSGAPEVTDFHLVDSDGGENNSGNALLVEVSETGEVRVNEVAVGTWRFESFIRDINSREDAERFIHELESYDNKSEVAVKYALRGSVDLATMRYLEQQISELTPIFAALFEWERHMDLTLDPAEEDIANMQLVGYQREAVEELVAAAPTSLPASDALRLMFRLSGEA